MSGAAGSGPHPPLGVRSGTVKAARKLLRRRYRHQQGLFLAEGWQAVEAAGTAVVEVFATPSAASQFAPLLAEHRVHVVDDAAFASLVQTRQPQGIVAVCRQPEYKLSRVLHDSPGSIVVVCDQLRDPGNAGTIIRTAAAIAAAAVVFTGDSVDVFNDKVIRASAGGLFAIPVLSEPELAPVLTQLRDAGYTIMAADGGAAVSLFDSGVALTQPTAWLVGNEARGLDPTAMELTDHQLAIPIPGKVESLNVAVAAAVCMYTSWTAHNRHQRGP